MSAENLAAGLHDFARAFILYKYDIPYDGNCEKKSSKPAAGPPANLLIGITAVLDKIRSEFHGHRDNKFILRTKKF